MPKRAELCRFVRPICSSSKRNARVDSLSNDEAGSLGLDYEIYASVLLYQKRPAWLQHRLAPLRRRAS